MTPAAEAVDLIRPAETAADIVATLLYPVTHYPFRNLYEIFMTFFDGPKIKSEIGAVEIDRGVTI